MNISSDAGRVGSTGEAVYAVCKGGVIAFTKTPSDDASFVTGKVLSVSTDLMMVG